MSASQRVVRFRKETQTPASGEEGIKVAGDSSFASSLLQLREQARRQFILRVGNGRAKINSSFPSWRQEDIRNVKGNSSLSLTKYRRRGTHPAFTPLTLTRSFVASTTAAFDPLIQLLIISVDETTTFQGENTIEKASRKDPPFQMRRHMMITIAAQLSFQNSWSFQKKG